MILKWSSEITRRKERLEVYGLKELNIKMFSKINVTCNCVGLLVGIATKENKFLKCLE